MKKDKLKKFINDGLSQRDIATLKNVSQSTIRYWLKKHNLKTGFSEERTCKYCGTTDQENFSADAQNVCLNCKNQKYIQRWIRLKKEWIDYLGGECQKCGYKKYYGALEFHHRDPSMKDAVWSQIKKWSHDRIKKEIDKCDLLCSNCHRETHAGVV